MKPQSFLQVLAMCLINNRFTLHGLISHPYMADKGLPFYKNSFSLAIVA